jgi:hypothetical protein
MHVRRLRESGEQRAVATTELCMGCNISTSMGCHFVAILLLPAASNSVAPTLPPLPILSPSSLQGSGHDQTPRSCLHRGSFAIIITVIIKCISSMRCIACILIDCALEFRGFPPRNEGTWPSVF